MLAAHHALKHFLLRAGDEHLDDVQMVRAIPNDLNLAIDNAVPLAVLDTPNALIHIYTLRDLPLEESQRLSCDSRKDRGI